MSFYNEKLSQERSDWVENTSWWTRNDEIFPLITKWTKDLRHNIVDIWCGQWDCSKYINSSIEYIWIDWSKYLIQRAQQLYWNWSSNKTFIQWDIYNIPLKDNSVEAIVSVWVYSHLKDINKASKEISRILESQWKFLIITANPWSYEERKSFYTTYTIEGNLLIWDFNLGKNKQLTYTNLYLHTLSELQDALQNAWLIIQSSYSIGDTIDNNEWLNIVFTWYKK